ncbi:carboxymuconolactone decarboxylase family protein [Yoonia sp. BS5-3]|uniref:Carboxymuconolactone decarboxylase family protein n=1 Tax=Yoonia phaeophyticola TaxID=3137369 RepID=A0ABZ2V884_9RHOB
MMTPRFDYMSAAPDAFRAVYGLEQYISEKSGLDPHLIHLIKLRASQINGCAYCVDMHSQEMRKDGISEQIIALVCVWRETPFFDARERAVLGWVEAVTKISDTGADDADYAPLKAHFDETDIANLTLAISTINVWNRLAISARTPPAVQVAA